MRNVLKRTLYICDVFFATEFFGTVYIPYLFLYDMHIHQSSATTDHSPGYSPVRFCKDQSFKEIEKRQNRVPSKRCTQFFYFSTLSHISGDDDYF